MTTKVELIQWLKSPDAIKVVLVEVLNVGLEGGGNTSFYFSSLPYTSITTNYDPIIVGGISFNESISLDGSASVGFGDIELENINGERDTWLNHYWNKRSINIYIGDIRWDRSAFYQIFGGLVDVFTMRDRNTLNIVLVDKLQKLNEPIQTRKIKDTIVGNIVLGSSADANKDKAVPIVLGEVFNIEALPCSNVINTLTYKVNDGDIYRILEVRDNGVPVNFTNDLALGTYTLSQASYGQITCSIQGKLFPTVSTSGVPVDSLIGLKGSQSPLTLAKYILTELGDTISRFTWDTTNVDIDSYTAVCNTVYGTYNSITYDHADIRSGVYCTGGENKLDVLQKLLGSASVYLIVASSGKLKFVKFELPSNNVQGTLTTITDDDFEYSTSTIEEITTPVSRVRAGFNKNYTIQDTNIAGSVSDNHRTLYREDYIITESSTDISVNNPYNLSTALPEVQETTFIDIPFAAIESSKRLAIWGVPRRVLTLTCYAHLMPVELGEFVHIKTNRFGLASGKNGTVISIDKSWLSGRVTVGVLL